MKANELRIGNFLQSDTNIIKIVGVVKKDIYYYHNKKNLYVLELNNFKPIPLTEEWLLRLGFDISSSSGYNIKNNGIEIDIWFNDDGLINDIQISSTNISGAYPNIKHFQYVHQLQNLYFALTNEELQIKC